ncbi:uncharacterized protein GGS25DRAFT_500327 [Hypoxylon fragiforme]|uniref:uncharacterized protein n=1 Tax=Hypoxylon fragiforme TaxID=63214 RepID=UPI0020C5E6F4|nr:uncharacterized protein GGS25DRAFT_500327 [Hypoxylon fragiforme]KAI2606258.1 hypothetical protein GGS25DRAFT_500327 [Hypoxylon fragiforme]
MELMVLCVCIRLYWVLPPMAHWQLSCSLLLFLSWLTRVTIPVFRFLCHCVLRYLVTYQPMFRNDNTSRYLHVSMCPIQKTPAEVELSRINAHELPDSAKGRIFSPCIGWVLIFR